MVFGSRLQGISSIAGFGHSYMAGTGSILAAAGPSAARVAVANGAYSYFDRLRHALRATTQNNYGIGGAILPGGEDITSGQGNGGWVKLGNNTPRPATTPNTPQIPVGQLYVIHYGLNDIGSYQADGAGLLRFQHAMRFAIVRCICSQMRDILDSSWASSAGGSTWGGSAADTTAPIATWFTANGSSPTVTATLPADFPGGDVWFVSHAQTVSAAVAGGAFSFTVDGVAAGSIDQRTVWNAGNGVPKSKVPVMFKIPGLAAGAHTIVGTVTAHSQFSFMGAWATIADPPGPIVLMVLPNRVPGSASAGYTYPYDGGNTITDTKILALRTAMIALAAEFPNNVVTVDADAIINLNAAYFAPAPVGNIHLNDTGYRELAIGCRDALLASPLLTDDFLLATS